MSHTRSTRTRLTLYFTAVFGVIVVGLAGASYAVFRQEAFTKLDSALQAAASATTMSAAHELAEHSEQYDGEADLQSIMVVASSASLPDTQILIREGERSVAYKGARGPMKDLRSLSTARLLQGGEAEGMRVTESDLAVPKFDAKYRIFAASSLEPTRNELRSFCIVVLICVPLGLAMAGMTGYFLARRSLAPLNELHRTIEALTCSDLSARVTLTKATSDFVWLAARFNSLLDRLEKAFHAQRQFMADASHELRTPLTVALAATQVTARDNLRSGADSGETLSLVEDQILRLKKIVDNMLFLTQVDASSLHLEQREFYLDDLISEAGRAARTLARTKQQSIRIAELPEACCVGDESLCKQALMILLDNAVKYAAPRGEIVVSLNNDGERCRCRVWNDGPGIPIEAQSHIFERFFRAANGLNAKSGGSGLGLSIARSIVETHGGSLKLIHSGEGGTTFELTLPVVAPSDERTSAQPKSLAVKM